MRRRSRRRAEEAEQRLVGRAEAKGSHPRHRLPRERGQSLLHARLLLVVLVQLKQGELLLWTHGGQVSVESLLKRLLHHRQVRNCRLRGGGCPCAPLRTLLLLRIRLPLPGNDRMVRNARRLRCLAPPTFFRRCKPLTIRVRAVAGSWRCRFPSSLWNRLKRATPSGVLPQSLASPLVPRRLHSPLPLMATALPPSLCLPRTLSCIRLPTLIRDIIHILLTPLWEMRYELGATALLVVDKILHLHGIERGLQDGEVWVVGVLLLESLPPR
mmetsp:Transcript_26487/g.47132  ORF Transcript_26487/g.47132 Transcript_26487/m.47132 type:complete len:270 (+) Transcript_26487:392-1201(+)